MPAYPDTLPAPLLDGYALSPVDPSIRTDMEVGGQRVRRRTRARNDRVDLSWCFTDAQMGDFRTWFDDETTGISGGAAWFDMLIDVGQGGATIKEVRFASMWKAARQDKAWKVTATLEVR